MAKSNDLKKWDILPGLYIQTRKDKFDSELVESGPHPLKLSDGNYLFLYNSARCCVPSIKPNWNIQYNVGYLILDGKDPTKILERSETPIYSPELAWEVGVGPYLGLTPNVVFVEGWERYKNQNNTFVAYYGAADSVMGAFKISVTKS